jgi:NAD(P)-dependent dehydrogenase (short-subunit alcohol dehydrogenase family)
MPSFNSRVVNVSSNVHRKGPIHFGNLNLKGIYTPRLGYGQSKTANILMANQIERLYGVLGVHGLAVSPGAIRSGAQRYDNPEDLAKSMANIRDILKNTAQGAATTVWAAVGKDLEGKGAKYLEDCVEGHAEVEDNVNTGGYVGGYATFAFDEEAEKRLWKLSCEMVGVKDE